MARRILLAAALFAVATAVTAALGRWAPSRLMGPLSASVLAALGLLLIGLAPRAPAPQGSAAHTDGDPRLAADEPPPASGLQSGEGDRQG